MCICLRGERQEVTKTLNWASDWPVRIEDEHRKSEEVGRKKSRDHVGTKGNWGLLMMGTIRHVCRV